MIGFSGDTVGRVSESSHGSYVEEDAIEEGDAEGVMEDDLAVVVAKEVGPFPVCSGGK